MNSAMNKKSGLRGGLVSAIALASGIGLAAAFDSVSKLDEGEFATVQKEGKTVRVEVKPGTYVTNPLTTSFIKWKPETKSALVSTNSLDSQPLTLRVSADYFVPDTYHMEEYTTFNHLFNVEAEKAAVGHIEKAMWRDIAGKKDFDRSVQDLCSEIASRIPATREGDFKMKARSVTCELTGASQAEKVVLVHKGGPEK